MGPIGTRLAAIHPLIVIVGVGATSYLVAGLFIGSAPALAKTADDRPGQGASAGRQAGLFSTLPATLPAQIPQTLFTPAAGAMTPFIGGASAGSGGDGGGSANKPNKNEHRAASTPVEANTEAPHHERIHAIPRSLVPRSVVPPSSPAPRMTRPMPAPSYPAPQPSRPPIVVAPRLPFFGGGFGQGGGAHFGGGGGRRH